MRFYMPHTLAELLRGVGFTDVELYGTLAGDPIDLGGLRAIARARRPPR